MDRDPHGLNVDTVKIDNFGGGYMATEYLLNLGHSSKERFNEYKRALKNKGISVPEEVSIVGFDDSYISPYIIPPLTTIKQR